MMLLLYRCQSAHKIAHGGIAAHSAVSYLRSQACQCVIFILAKNINLPVAFDRVGRNKITSLVSYPNRHLHHLHRGHPAAALLFRYPMIGVYDTNPGLSRTIFTFLRFFFDHVDVNVNVLLSIALTPGTFDNEIRAGLDEVVYDSRMALRTVQRLQYRFRLRL
jgi:hypothetical protein